MSSLQQNWQKGQNRFCVEEKGVGGKWRVQQTGGRNDPNNICAFEYKNKKKRKPHTRTHKKKTRKLKGGLFEGTRYVVVGGEQQQGDGSEYDQKCIVSMFGNVIMKLNILYN
jgi:hypothetical protein